LTGVSLLWFFAIAANPTIGIGVPCHYDCRQSYQSRFLPAG
jgi:hypothetical protein